MNRHVGKVISITYGKLVWRVQPDGSFHCVITQSAVSHVDVLWMDIIPQYDDNTVICGYRTSVNGVYGNCTHPDIETATQAASDLMANMLSIARRFLALARRESGVVRREGEG